MFFVQLAYLCWLKHRVSVGLVGGGLCVGVAWCVCVCDGRCLGSGESPANQTLSKIRVSMRGHHPVQREITTLVAYTFSDPV